MSPESGRRFGPYEIHSRLGGGGMGHVYRAWDARLHREVAIKLLNHEFAMPGMRERFLREARAASALNHPNICSIFDIGEQDGDPYLVMELLEGETLKDRIQNHTISIPELICIARETAEALGAAHSKGVVHRDIKPANIFLVTKPNGIVQAKVLDFGLAKIDGGVLGGRSRASDLTSVGATVGTLAYMSPEQARGELLDSRSDLFSLGVVMYEMATRQVPFQGATSALVFVQLLNHPPDPVRDWNEAVPRELEKIIFKLLAKERTARFQTAHDVELALLAVLDKGGAGGWLRKAVNSVPLVRAPDPVARNKRAPAARASGLTAPAGAERGATPPPPDAATQRPAADRMLRPVARLPRQEATPHPEGHPAVPPPAATHSPAPAPVASPAPTPGGRSQAALPDAQDGRKPVSSGQVLIQPRRPFAPSGTPVPENKAAEYRPLPATAEPVRLAEQSRTGIPARIPAGTPTTAAGSSDALSSFLDDEDQAETTNLARRRWLLFAAVGVAVMALLAFMYHRTQLRATLLNKGDALVVGHIVNQTGVRTLDDAVTEGVRIALSESSWLIVRDQLSLEAAERQIAPSGNNDPNSLVVARRAAERLGARAYLGGTLSGNSPPYVLHVDLRDVKSNDVMVSAQASGTSVQQVANAIDQVALELRLRCGESLAGDRKVQPTLAQEATANPEALQAFAEAEAHLSSGLTLVALAELQRAAAVDPHFIQAQLALAALYRQLHAESASAASSRLALEASANASERTRLLAESAYETDATGDFPRATAILRQLTAAYPADPEALSLLAENLLLEGHLSEGLQNAQEAYRLNPFDAFAHEQAERALLALDRYDAAFQLQSQQERLGIAEQDASLSAAYLDNRPDLVAEIAASIPLGSTPYRPDLGFGLYLDNAGHLAAGAGHWTSRADAAFADDSLKSAGVFLMAQAAFDRALLGDCKSAAAFEHAASSSNATAGRLAAFRLGIADAMCGDISRAQQILATLQQQYPSSFEVNGFFAPDIQAAIAIREGQPQAAIDALQPARPYDLISITPFLRGQAHVSHGEVEVGIVDLQTVLAHRGAAFVAGSSVYPAAQIDVARAFAGSGDVSNGAAAYARFLDLWRTADPLNPLVVEARSRAARQ